MEEGTRTKIKFPSKKQWRNFEMVTIRKNYFININYIFSLKLVPRCHFKIKKYLNKICIHWLSLR